MRLSAVLVALAVWSLAPVAPVAHAGPWAQGQGHFYLNLKYSGMRGTTYAQPDGTRFEIPRFSSDLVSFFGSFGLTDGLTLWTDIPFLQSSDVADDPNELPRATGFGDIQVSLQAQLARKGPWVFAVRGTVQAPTGDETKGQGLLPTGSGAWEAKGIVGAGLSFGRGRGYGYLELGYQYRGRGYRDAFPYELQVGWRVGGRTYVVWNTRGMEPFSHEPGTGPDSASFVGVGDRVTYLTFGPSLLTRFGTSWGLQLDFEGGTHARNVVDGRTVRLSITFQK